MTVTEMTETQEYEIPITFRNIGEGLALSAEMPKTVKVSVSGPISALKTFDKDQITVIADLYGYAAGQYDAPIRMSVDGRTNDLTIAAAQETVPVELNGAEE